MTLSPLGPNKRKGASQSFPVAKMTKMILQGGDRRAASEIIGQSTIWKESCQSSWSSCSARGLSAVERAFCRLTGGGMGDNRVINVHLGRRSQAEGHHPSLHSDRLQT